jgi:hypothetical protein
MNQDKTPDPRLQIVERTRCAIVDGDPLEHLYTFRNFPVFMGCSNKPRETDLHHDMSWWIGKNAGVIQLKSLLPLEVIYADAHGAGEVGALWDKHHAEFARFISQFAPEAVFEIGGAHGILETKYQQHRPIPWTIIEPNPAPVPGCRARFIQGFFKEGFSFQESFDTVVHSHVLEHIYRPNEFMHQLAGFMDIGKKLLFTLPNMEPMLKRKYTNCINFEHTIYLNEPYIEYLLAKHGFKLLKKEYFKEDHSIFYAAVRADGVPVPAIPADSHARNKLMYLDYTGFHERQIAEINAKIGRTDRPIYLFGAHVFAQYLIAFGLETSRVVCLLDNDPKKHGKRLYGTDLQVASPKILRDVKQPVVILKAGVYNDEIRKDIVDNINPETEFWE